MVFLVLGIFGNSDVVDSIIDNEVLKEGYKVRKTKMVWKFSNMSLDPPFVNFFFLISYFVFLP